MTKTKKMSFVNIECHNLLKKLVECLKLLKVKCKRLEHNFFVKRNSYKGVGIYLAPSVWGDKNKYHGDLGNLWAFILCLSSFSVVSGIK